MAIFKTERLIIRELSKEDIEQLEALLSDETTMQYAATGVLSRSQIEGFVEHHINEYSSTGFGYWAIAVQSSGQIVGLCGLNRHEVEGERTLHVNYRLDSRCLGKGFATETVNGLKQYCSDKLNESKLAAIIALSNIESMRVVERAGFSLLKETKFKAIDVKVYQINL